MDPQERVNSAENTEISEAAPSSLSREIQNLLRDKIFSKSSAAPKDSLPKFDIILPSDADMDPGFYLKPDPNERLTDPGIFLKPDPNERLTDPGIFLKPDPNERNIDREINKEVNSDAIEIPKLKEPAPSANALEVELIPDPEPKIDFAENITGKEPTKVVNTKSSRTEYFSGRDDGLKLERTFKANSGHSDSRMKNVRVQEIYEDGTQRITDIHGNTKVKTPLKPEQPKLIAEFQGQKDGLVKQEISREWTISSFKEREDGLKQHYKIKPELKRDNSVVEVLKYEDGKEVYTYGNGKVRVHEAPKSRSRK